jgi:hypothetical protein
VSELAKVIDQIEMLCTGDIEAGRNLLREFLLEYSGDEESKSIGDALSNLAKTPTEHRDLAAALIRFLDISALLPEPNANNQIARSIVEIATGSLPNLCSFLRMAGNAQTYQNFVILRGAHQRICTILTPLRADPGST